MISPSLLRYCVQEAAKYAPTYYRKMIDRSITKTLIPAPCSANGVTPANLAISSGLDFGSEAYRRQLSARIAHARGEMEKQPASSRDAGLSKTLNRTASRAMKGPQPQRQSAKALHGGSPPAANAEPPVLARVRGRRPRMVVRIVDQAPLSAR